MDAERFGEIRRLFDAAMELPAEARPAFLKEACQTDPELLAEVERLLAAHTERTGLGVIEPAAKRREGTRVGPYEIQRKLGQGGMGAVYLAQRADGVFRKTVAIKIVAGPAPGDDAIARFQRERDVLAALDHPNIARILDGGTTEDGLPYLVMEFVDGKPIDAYCDEHRLDVAARIRLFRDVCSAVQYAHKRHVIHRDIKPGNVLVTPDGVVKLLDFGIAKVAEAGSDATTLTRTDLLAMTPEYASPEQINGETITPMTDVYALGILLYELLTGRRPYRFTTRIFREIARVICEEEPARPSDVILAKDAAEQAPPAGTISRLRASSPEELKRRLRGDLDSVLTKALEKDPARRYRSPGDFSEDLRRHLEHQPVGARRREWLSEAGKFAYRQRWWLAGGAAAALGEYFGVLDIPLTIWLAMVLLLFSRSRIMFRLKSPTPEMRLVNYLVVILPVAFLIGFTGANVLTDLTKTEDSVLVFSSVLAVGQFFGFLSAAVSWLRRDRLGQLIVDLTPLHRSRKGWLSVDRLGHVGSLALTGVGLTGAIAALGSAVPWGDVVAGFSFVLMSAGFSMMFALIGRIELRPPGFVMGGVLLPWKRVLLYSWDAPSEDGTTILRLRVENWWWWGKPVIRVPSAEREKIDALLARELFEWPARSTEEDGTKTV